MKKEIGRMLFGCVVAILLGSLCGAVLAMPWCCIKAKAAQIELKECKEMGK